MKANDWVEKKECYWEKLSVVASDLQKVASLVVDWEPMKDIEKETNLADLSEIAKAELKEFVRVVLKVERRVASRAVKRAVKRVVLTADEMVAPMAVKRVEMTVALTVVQKVA